MNTYILALDQGTSSSRAILFDREGNIKSSAQKEFPQLFPEEGWVEHQPEAIWSSQVAVAAEAMSRLGINGKNLAGIGITNQRETTIIWDRETGKPVYNAIVWQDRRTAPLCRDLENDGYNKIIKEKTGLLLDSYFSATKIKWILDHVPGARKKASQGKLAFGTIDSWIIWNLTRGRIHVTDVSNASRTLLFNIYDLTWDTDLLRIFDIPEAILPEVKSSSEIISLTNTTFFATKVPIAGIAGDQQAALFGQLCTQPGMAKNTYGTGCFILMNIGKKLQLSDQKMLTTIAWQIHGETTYAMEGSIFNAGTAVQWLRDGLRFFDNSLEIESLAASVNNNGGVYMVPAFTGLGVPYWDPYARGVITGITRSTNRAHIARAVLESMAYQTKDVLEEMKKLSGIHLKELKADGGASVNNLLMQFQADILNLPVNRPCITETTALGAAYLAGLATGYWQNTDELKNQYKIDRSFNPQMDPEKINALYKKWKKATEKAANWTDKNE